MNVVAAIGIWRLPSLITRNSSGVRSYCGQRLRKAVGCAGVSARTEFVRSGTTSLFFKASSRWSKTPTPTAITSASFSTYATQTSESSATEPALPPLGQKDTSSSSSLDALKVRLLQKSLDEVPVHGWTNDAIAAAVVALDDDGGGNVSVAAAGLITVSDLIAFTMDQWNDRLRNDLVLEFAAQQQQQQQQQGPVLSTSPPQSTTVLTTTFEKIVWALQRRLSYEQDLIRANRWHEGMALGAHPDSLQKTQQQVAAVIDIVLSSVMANDSSVEHNANNSSSSSSSSSSSISFNEQQQQQNVAQQFSTMERLSLGAVYVATELHMLTDSSMEFRDTWVFLRERVRDWEILRQTTAAFGWFPNSSSSSSTAGVTHPFYQYHTPADIVSTASAVGSALWSGAQSLVVSTSTPLQPPSNQVQQHAYTGQGDDYSFNDASHPSYYESPSSTKKET